MSRKIGIITHYHNSKNYGGNLQAYALCRFLFVLGSDAKQISYRQQMSEPVLKAQIGTRLRRILKPKQILHAVVARITNRMLRDKLNQRHAAIDSFNKQQIPHSQQVYTKQTIQTCDQYDAYITGSDQVWNPAWYHSAYFLDFVPSGKPKISYAASMGVSTLTEQEKERMRQSLADFTAVSVREQDAVMLLDPIVPVPVEWVLDPTLLLTRQQWDEVCSERLVPEKYIFTYFLGDDAGQRKLAKAFARQKGLPIVTLPHIHGVFRSCDFAYGNRKLYDVSPADFISLIKHAEYVLTDSFHGTVFANIYQREYFVFPRKGKQEMESRIYSLAKLVDGEAHFCDTPDKQSLSYMESVSPVDYEAEFPELEKRRRDSEKFLEKALGIQL